MGAPRVNVGAGGHLPPPLSFKGCQKDTVRARRGMLCANPPALLVSLALQGEPPQISPQERMLNDRLVLRKDEASD